MENEVNCSSVENNATAEELPPQVYIISLFSFLSLIGCVAILLTYSLFKELRSLPGKILMNLATAILVASIFTLSSLFVVEKLAVCKTIAIILQYTYTAEFIWMSVLSFELARALRQANTALINKSARMERVGFLVYLVIGWGIPLLVTTCTTAVNFTQTDYVRYGGPRECKEGEYCPDRYCFITEGWGYVFALFIPVGTSLLFNIVAAMFSGYVITRATMNRYKLHNMHQTILYVRVLIPIIVITGAAYILCAIFVTIRNTYEYNWALYLFIALGLAQGFLVSVVFILKKRIANLYKMWCISLYKRCRRISDQKCQISQKNNLYTKNGNHVTPTPSSAVPGDTVLVTKANQNLTPAAVI